MVYCPHSSGDWVLGSAWVHEKQCHGYVLEIATSNKALKEICQLDSKKDRKTRTPVGSIQSNVGRTDESGRRRCDFGVLCHPTPLLGRLQRTAEHSGLAGAGGIAS